VADVHVLDVTTGVPSAFCSSHMPNLGTADSALAAWACWPGRRSFTGGGAWRGGEVLLLLAGAGCT
jgi:hypothetical protein